MKSVLSPCVEIARKRRYANLNAFVVQLLRQFGKIEVAPTHPLQCRSLGKDGFPGSQRTTSIKPDSGGFEAGKFRPDGFDLIRGNPYADGLQSLLPFPVKRDACPLASRT